jgi:hypothetical protein
MKATHSKSRHNSSRFYNTSLLCFDCSYTFWNLGLTEHKDKLEEAKYFGRLRLLQACTEKIKKVFNTAISVHISNILFYFKSGDLAPIVALVYY